MSTKRKKILSILAGIILILVLFIAFLPAILSTGPGRAFVLKKVNAKIPGKLAVDNWSLSWKKSIELQGVSFVEEGGGLNLKVASVKLSKGIYPLATGYPNLGTIVVDQPNIEVRLPEAKEEPPEPVKPTPKPGRGGGSKGSSTPKAEEPLMPPIEANFLVKGGVIKTIAADDSVSEVLRGLELTLDIQGAEQTLQYDISAQSGIGAGTLSGKGKIVLPPAGAALVDHIQSDSQLKVADFILDDTFDLLAARFDMPKAKGRLNADVSIVGSLAKGFDIKGATSVATLQVAQEEGAAPIDFGDLKLDVDANVLTDSIKLSVLNVTSSFCSVESSGTFGGKNDGTFAAVANADLSRVALLLERFKLMPEGMKLAGLLVLNASGSTEAGKLVLDTFKTDITQLHFQQDDRSFREAKLSVTAKGVADLANHSLAFSALNVDTSFADVELSELTMGNWTNAPATLSLKGGVDVQLAALLGAARDFVSLPEKSTVAGGLKAKIDFQWPQLDTQKIRINAEVLDLKIDGPDWPKLDEKQLRLMTDLVLVGDTNEMDVTINKVFLASEPVTLDVKGAFKQSGLARNLKADGEIAYELERLASYFDKQIGMDMVLKGKHQKPFSFQSDWEGEDWAKLMENARITAELEADHLEFFGIVASSLTVPILSEDGVTSADLAADLEGGKLSIKPSIDFKDEKPFIVFPPNLNLIQGMNLSDGMADGLLGRIHPAFHKGTVTRGTLDFVMNNFKWPMDQQFQNEAAFDGQVDFVDLKLEAKGLIYQIMSVAKMKEREVEIDRKGFQFALKDNRIESSPLKIKIKDTEIILAGTMGLDQTLDYYVELPVTEEMIGEKYIKYAEGITVRIPITGTASKPKVDLRAMDKILGEVIVKAGKSKLTEELGGRLGEKLGGKLDEKISKELEGELGEKANELLKGLFK